MEKFARFDEIRPFDDNEVPGVIKQIINDPQLEPFFTSVFQYFNFEKFIRHLAKVKTVYEFQSIFAFLAMKSIVLNSIDKFTNSNLDKLLTDKSYLLISNHRDIVLDSSLMNFVMFDQGHNTCQTAIGDNLFVSPLITNLLKLNKSFTVKRNVNPRALYDSSVLLSEYISYVINDRKESVWIAQREGRAKDGNDRTQIGLLKMLMMNLDRTKKEEFFELNIVPIAISYQYDPCDFLKAIELFTKANNLPFEKTPEMDYKSMILGITGNKGNVHISFTEPITDIPSDLQFNDWVKCLADTIDATIHCNYKLWNTNYIAFDQLNGNKQFAANYTEEEELTFMNYLSDKFKYYNKGIPFESLQPIILSMYAKPVENFLACKKS